MIALPPGKRSPNYAALGLKTGIGASHLHPPATRMSAMIRFPEVFMGLPRLAWSSLTASAVLIAALATPAQSQQPQQQPGSIRSNHGAWSVICDKPAGSTVQIRASGMEA